MPTLICTHQQRGTCACRAWPSPAVGCLAPGHMASPEPGGLCPVLLGASWCSELAPGSVGTGTSSDPAPCPCSGMRQGVW